MTSKTKSSGIADALLRRIESREALVGVIGLGYVGLPLSIELAKAGFRVLGFDVSQRVVEGINAGHSHVGDVPDDALAALVRDGMIEATTDAERMADCDVLSICVPTPLSKTRDPDVSYVVSATDAVRRTLRAGQLILLESTTYPGTTRDLVLPALASANLEVGEDFFLCFSPERVDPGNPVWHVKNTPKVVGGITPACLTMGVALYSRVMDTVVPVSSTEAAEMTKILENTFRSINIALVNEMAQVADRLNVDVWEVIEAAATKPFGFMKFLPGPGIGGHCIPLDPHYLAWKMKTLNYRTRMIEIASEISAEMPRYVTTKVQDALNMHSKSVKGSRILVLGVAYKRNIDDVRESPALDVMKLLEEKEAIVTYHDPFVPEFTEDGHRHASVELTDEVLRRADCVVIITDHQGIDYARVVRLARVVVDTRNATAGAGASNVVGLSGPRRTLAVEAGRKEPVPA